MRLLRPASFFLSLCLHAGVIGLVFFLPQSDPRVIDLTGPVIDVNIYTIGKPGAAPTAQKPPQTPPQTPATPATPPKPPATPPDTPTPPPDTAKPTPTPVKPEPAPVPIPPPPDEPKKPDPPKPEDPPKPVEPPKPEPAKPEPAKPAGPEKPAGPAKHAAPAKPQKSADDVLREALGELKGQTPDPDSTDPKGTGPGGKGGDGIGLLGSYQDSLRSRIWLNWEAPPNINRQNATVRVRIRIARDGTILEAEIVESSNNTGFNGSVLKAIRDTQKVEPPSTPDLMVVELSFGYEAPGR